MMDVLYDTPVYEQSLLGARAGIMIKGERPKRTMGKKKPQLYDKGRVCTTEECESVLSMYNKGLACFTHQPRKPPRIRGRITR